MPLLLPHEIEFLERDLKEIEIHNLRLIDFVKSAWQVLEPGTEYIHGWHIDAICEHLEAVSRGEIRNLLINMPPRHAKSLLVSVFWPVWEWVKNPHVKYLFTSYAQTLSTRDSLKCRRLILSPWFQQRYGHRFRITSDQRAKTRFDNDQMGYRIATSVGGVGTGEGGDRVVCDDPHNVNQAESRLVRESTLLWWDESMSTRLNNPKKSAKIVVMQRLNEIDLSGHILLQGGYEHLMLPAEYEHRIHVTCIGWSDPRKEDGELLWPERFGIEELTELKNRLGVYGAAGQLQQRPAPREGGIIRIDRIQEYESAPNFTIKLQSWDTAFKDGRENDYSVCTTWGICDGYYYLIDRYKAKMQYPDLKNMFLKLCIEYRPAIVLVEDAASGQSLVQEMKRPIIDQENKNMMYTLPIKAIKPENDKILRAHASAPTIETKMLIPKHAPWKQDLLSNLAVFPKGAHDDDVDSITQAILYLNQSNKFKINKLDYMSR